MKNRWLEERTIIETTRTSLSFLNTAILSLAAGAVLLKFFQKELFVSVGALMLMGLGFCLGVYSIMYFRNHRKRISLIN